MDDPKKIILDANNDFSNYFDEITLVEQSFKTIRDFVSDLKQQLIIE